MVYVLCIRGTRVSQQNITDDSARVNSPRLVATQTRCNNALPSVIWEESLSMVIGRARGLMEWSGAVKGRAGVGVGVSGGGGEGGGAGE